MDFLTCTGKPFFGAREIDNQTIYAWQEGKSVTARWGQRQVVVPEFSTLFAEIQERRGIVSATISDAKVWQVVVLGSCRDILRQVFRSGTLEQGEAPMNMQQSNPQ